MGAGAECVFTGGLSTADTNAGVILCHNCRGMFSSSSLLFTAKPLDGFGLFFISAATLFNSILGFFTPK